MLLLLPLLWFSLSSFNSLLDGWSALIGSKELYGGTKKGRTRLLSSSGWKKGENGEFLSLICWGLIRVMLCGA
ncbi:hypothetical protein K402DRAFT_396459 [Aulographum hederae CBS 113979]|uniref:Secreted protein n=1 Tax=Aulographum hederae CBS 113979 TaxID=1176131 RepID=A0A6G1GRV7_9PEZI|nr:hypothetical protein K402DRAFT_396459 [Aulographum hederae CBS 113979]